MKKLILGVAVSGIMGLTGCGDSPEEPIVSDGTGAGSPLRTKAVYSPSTGSIPLPNDLLFNGTEDLTLNIPVVDAMDYGDPKVALSGLDGWSGIAPMAISFSNVEGVDLDPATIIPGSTIRLFETNVYRPEAIPGTGVPVPSGPVTGIANELVAGVDFVATYAGPNTAAIIPLRSLTQQASYMVVVTNGVTDANGVAVDADLQYALAKSSQPLTGSTAALEPVRQLVNAMEAAADSVEGLSKDDIVVSYQFTVQSLGDVVSKNKAWYIDFPLSQGQVPATSFTNLGVTTLELGAGAGAAGLYKGQMTLNYYLGASQNAYDPANTTTRFLGADIIPNPAFDAQQPPSETNPFTIANPFAGGNTTYANPIVKVNGLETVPLLASLPTNPQCPKPYPVMIFQHGITSNRTNMVGIADTMGSICTAVVAMDMPLHGIAADNSLNLALGGALFEGYEAGTLRERTFGVDFNADGIADSSGAYTMNLLNLLVARDNNRQAALDLLTLEKALLGMDVDGDGLPDFVSLTETFQPDLASLNMSFMGHSWGGIVGNIFLAHSDFTKVAVLANTGGSLMGMIDGSPQFGDPVKAALMASGMQIPSADYSSFLFAGQTAIDDGDSIHSYAMNLANGIPTLAMQVAGDTAVPNAVATSPTAGTIPMSMMLGLSTVSATEPGETVVGDRLFSKFKNGIHGTVLTPLDDDGVPTYLATTTAMQTQIATFIGSGGAMVTVTDPSLLD